MTEHEVSNRILTVPNAVSFIRLGAIPVFWWLVLVADDVTSGTILLALVATTDWIDGYLARRLGQVSRLGKALDPVADRLMIASAVVVGLIAGIVPMIIGITLLVRETYMTMVVALLLLRGRGVLEVTWLGKLATVIIYTSIVLFYVAEIPFLEPLTRPLAWIGGLGGLILYWITAIQYTAIARDQLALADDGSTARGS